MIAHTPIRVLLVDDSPFAIAALMKLLSGSLEVEIVGTAKNGREALGLIPLLNPRVVCTKIDMPVMNGLELTKTIMSDCPLPILLVVESIPDDHADNVSQALAAGAIDFYLRLPNGTNGENQRKADELIQKIMVLAGVVPFKRRTAVSGDAPVLKKDRKLVHEIRIAAIGASVGGPQALNTVLRSLPGSCPVPIICVQHIGTGFLQNLVDWLGTDSLLKIKMAESGERPVAGTVYFPQEGTHLIVDQAGNFSHSIKPSVSGHRPSITVTFKSVSSYFRNSAAGILMTGMGQDGADGLKEIFDRGGLTIAQDEQTSAVFGMARHAIELGAARYVLPINQIARTLMAEITGQQESR